MLSLVVPTWRDAHLVEGLFLSGGEEDVEGVSHDEDHGGDAVDGSPVIQVGTVLGEQPDDPGGHEAHRVRAHVRDAHEGPRKVGRDVDVVDAEAALRESGESKSNHHEKDDCCAIAAGHGHHQQHSDGRQVRP